MGVDESRGEAKEREWGLFIVNSDLGLGTVG